MKNKIQLTQDEKAFGTKYNISIARLTKIKTYFEGEEDWLERFKENPYELMEAHSFGFITCDKLAEKIGFDMKSILRIRAYILVAVEKTSKGDSILFLDEVTRSIENDLGVDRDLIYQAILSYKGRYVLLDSRFKSMTKEDIRKGSRPYYITTVDWFEAERYIYNYLRKLSRQPTPNIDGNIIDSILKKNPTLNEQQKKAVEGILEKNISLVIGSSGTGKSFLTKTLLDVLDWHKYTYTLLAPTGIASFNLSNKVGRESNTIHRRYYTYPSIDTDYVIIDEIGMCGYTHFLLLEKMLKEHTKVIFIGDKYQLPSISAGDFLSDIMKLIQSKKIDGNIFELTKVMRASDDKDITTVCNMFCGGNKFNTSVIKENLNGVKFLPQEEDLFRQIETVIKKNKWKWEDTAVIMPQKKGKHGCANFNQYIQDKRKEKVLFENRVKKYKEGDILMHIKNNTGLGIYNGEMIKLVAKSNKSFVCTKLYNNEMITYDLDTLTTQTVLGYSFTVHKSQGCTIKNVIFIAIPEFTYMLSRNLMYVGMSRASENLVVIGNKETIRNTSYKTLTDKRVSFLGIIANQK